ncbi:(Uracil-5)-methyltransferase family [Trinorchestia longiramus]|nr:(Uracil-5)-methyltransferase family [Trinorchestia longiramus]
MSIICLGLVTSIPVFSARGLNKFFMLQKASPAPDPLLKVIEQKVDGTFKCANEEMDKLPIEERVTLSVTPYAAMPYKQQLEKKQEAAQAILKKIGREIARVNPELESLVRWQKLRRRGAVCEMDPIIPSPVEDGYRNKCEFTIGMNSDSKETTVGFRVSSYKEGNVSVGPVLHLKHISDTMKNIVKSFEAHVRASDYAAFDPVSHEGVWRQLTVRTSNNHDCLLIVTVHPQKLGESELGELKQSLVHYCETEGTQAGVTGLYCIVVGQKESGVTEEYEHLWGGTHITETVLGKKFRISPQAFFQVNTPAAEKLYEAVAELSEVDRTNVLLDVCCGTGTIGQCLAERTYKMYGLEIVEKAVEDAEYNARINKISNVDYLLGNCEQTLPSIYSSCKGLEVKAVVDPPRAGLPASVIASLRKHEEVTSVVYMACDPVKCHQNFQSFARPISKNLKGQFFIPIRAVAVDLFPHTDKYELVIVWERYDEFKWRRILDGNPRPKDEAYYSRVPELPQQKNTEELAENKKVKSSTKMEATSTRQWKPRFNSGGYNSESYRSSPSVRQDNRGGSWRNGQEDRRYSQNYGRRDDYSRGDREDFKLSPWSFRSNRGGYGDHFGGRSNAFQDQRSRGRGPYQDPGRFYEGDCGFQDDNYGGSEDCGRDVDYDGNDGFMAGDPHYRSRGRGYGNGREELVQYPLPGTRAGSWGPRGGISDSSSSGRLGVKEFSDHGLLGDSPGGPSSYGGQFGPGEILPGKPGKSSYGGVDPYSAAVAGYMAGFEAAKKIAANVARDGAEAFPAPQGRSGVVEANERGAFYSRAPGGPPVRGDGTYAVAGRGEFGGDEADGEGYGRSGGVRGRGYGVSGSGVGYGVSGSGVGYGVSGGGGG